MTIEVAVKNVEPSNTAFLAVKGPFDQMPGAFGKLIGWLGSKGYAPAGPPFGVFFDDPAQVAAGDLRWELHSPIGEDVPPSGPDEEGLGVKCLEATEYAFAVHKGPYDQAGPVWRAVAEWISGQRVPDRWTASGSISQRPPQHTAGRAADRDTIPREGIGVPLT
jgi:DNA gyrase inhibitor GyrI